MRTLSWGAALAAISMAQFACLLDDPCDPGQRFEEATFTCLDVPEDSMADAGPAQIGDGGPASVDGGPASVDGGPASVDGGPGSSDGGSVGIDGGAPNDAGEGCASEFGQSCGASSECGCDTTFCAANPGEAGFCTVTHCMSAPEVCPEGFRCVDVSAVAPQLESLCAPG